MKRMMTMAAIVIAGTANAQDWRADRVAGQ